LPGGLKYLHIVAQQFYLNAFLLIASSIFCFFDVPTHLGGFCMFIAGVWYLIAAISQEKPKTIKDLKGGARPE